MATKTTTKKAATKKVDKKMDMSFEGEYFYAVGRRKTAIAQVRLYKKTDATEDDFIVNGKKMTDYFPTTNEHDIFREALRATGAEGNIAITVLVRGGGLSGQVQAIRLGIARALVKIDEGHRAILKSEGLMTRDSRVVERKKPGLRKARRSPQWSKR